MLKRAIIVGAGAPALAAILLAVVTETDPSRTARLLVTAFAYALVAVGALRLGSRAIAGVCGALSTTSAWLALALVLQALAPEAAALHPATVLLVHVARIPELAALAVLPWLVARSAAGEHRLAIAVGIGAPALSAALSLVGTIVPVPGLLGLVPLVWAVIGFLAGAVVVAARWLRGDTRERMAAAWFLVGAALLVVSYVRVLLPLPEPLALLADASFVVAQGFLPVAVLVSVVSRARQGVEVRLADAFAWLQALALSVGAYLLVTAAARALDVDVVMGGAIAAAVLALTLGGFVTRSRVWVRRLVTRSPPDARELLRRLSDRVVAADALPSPLRAGAGLDDIARSLRDTFALAAVEISVDDRDRTAFVGALVAGAESASVALPSGGRSIGRVALFGAPGAGVAPVVVVIEQTAGLLAAVVLLVVVNEESAATRTRSLVVRREERRLLQLELHDHLTPRLAAIGEGMLAADGLLARGDATAAEEIDVLRQATAACTEDVRRLARTLLPTALDQGDLDAALTELAGMTAGSGVVLRVHAPGSDVLDAADQLRVYLVVAQAVSHARRATSVGSVDVDVRIDERSVRTALRLGGPATAVTGLRAEVADRAEELGMVVSSTPDGVEAVMSR
ncbi:hypothetical protein GCM10009775_23550 [Microbacterium aoyamense]|uniref:Signal transduction histidine kinase subgroup 3 dimerisation and phosphoacceptor domain-containing protein n=1 Tax=Microbacterium aoyamense TaxID=344166 RepID=A0ABN2PTL5_9MICO|nr:histidine kinase [Microbacterium aoyamense]